MARDLIFLWEWGTYKFQPRKQKEIKKVFYESQSIIPDLGRMAPFDL